MPNTYFQFKQFRINQERCAMKVCTDACLQGAYAIAWLKKELKNIAKNDYRVLDIGTGTGLLSLMLAQEFSGFSIDAVEFDGAAYKQAAENIASSPWPERINVLQGDIREFDPGEKYDFIICNPPFYNQALKSKDDRKNQARHGSTLNFQELTDAVTRHLLPAGAACLMLPPRQFRNLSEIAKHKYIYPKQILYVRQSVHSGIFRVIVILKAANTDVSEEDISIRNEESGYTDQFKMFLKDFYLKF